MADALRESKLPRQTAPLLVEFILELPQFISFPHAVPCTPLPVRHHPPTHSLHPLDPSTHVFERLPYVVLRKHFLSTRFHFSPPRSPRSSLSSIAVSDIRPRSNSVPQSPRVSLDSICEEEEEEETQYADTRATSRSLSAPTRTLYTDGVTSTPVDSAACPSPAPMICLHNADDGDEDMPVILFNVRMLVCHFVFVVTCTCMHAYLLVEEQKTTYFTCLLFFLFSDDIILFN